MNEKQRKQLQRRMLIAAAIVFFIGLVIYMFGANALTIYKLEKQKTEIQQGIEDEEVRSNQLDEQVEQMGSKSYVEYIARKYLGLYYSDETIVIPVIDEQTTESDGESIG